MAKTGSINLTLLNDEAIMLQAALSNLYLTLIDDANPITQVFKTIGGGDSHLKQIRDVYRLTGETLVANGVETSTELLVL